MIHGVSANHSSFHDVTFNSGLNVIVAARSATSSERDTRNGVGKSMLIEIIDFCLGSKADPRKGLRIPPLADWAFTLELTIGDNRVSATRRVDDPGRVYIEGRTAGWERQPDNDSADAPSFSVRQWRSLLGAQLFGVSDPQVNSTYTPHFRSLISYFVRRRADAYLQPFQHFRQQRTWDWQLHIAYLLGLNWEYVANCQGLRDDEDDLKLIEAAIKTGAMESVVGTVGEMETKRIQLEQQIAIDSRALTTFRLHPQYESIEQEADRLTRTIHDLANLNVLDRRLLARYEESIEEESTPSDVLLDRLYEESGFVLSVSARRTLDQARTFHRQIIANRRDFLETEVDRIRESISRRETQVRDLSEQRATVMEVLRTHGALHEMTKLQERHGALKGQLDRVQSNLRDMKELNSKKLHLKTAKAELSRVAARDHEERRDTWSHAIRFFNGHSQALYETPGELVIELAEYGYKCRVDIERSGSEGIEKMKILCFDLALFQMQHMAGRGIDFVIHDTILYDSVDTRQRALAFERAHRVATETGGQYICTVNSDMIPGLDFTDGFDFQQHVRLTLSDSSPSESLFGMRFDRSNE